MSAVRMISLVLSVYSVAHQPLTELLSAQMSRRLFPSRPNGKSTTKSPNPGAGGYMIIEPFQLETPPPQQPPPHSPQPPVHTNRDPLPPQQSPTTTPIYDKQVKLVADRTEERS